jgi:hypothetical protein
MRFHQKDTRLRRAPAISAILQPVFQPKAVNRHDKRLLIAETSCGAISGQRDSRIDGRGTGISDEDARREYQVAGITDGAPNENLEASAMPSKGGTESILDTYY